MRITLNKTTPSSYSLYVRPVLQSIVDLVCGIFRALRNVYYRSGMRGRNITLFKDGLTSVNQGKVKEVWIHKATPNNAYYTPLNFLQEAELKEELQTCIDIKQKLGEEGIKHLAVDWEEVPVESRIKGKFTIKTSKAEGDLEKAIRDPEHPLDAAEQFSVCSQILKGMNSLHIAGYYHGDPKLENTLYSWTPEGIRIKVSDFGKAKIAKAIPDTYWGNTRHAGPEFTASQKGDVWGTGMMLIRILEQKILKDLEVECLCYPHDTGLFTPFERRGIETFMVSNKYSPATETRGLQALLGKASKLKSIITSADLQGLELKWLHNQVALYIGQLIIHLCDESRGFVKKPEDRVTIIGLGSLLMDMMHVDPEKRLTIAEALGRFEALKIELEKPVIEAPEETPSLTPIVEKETPAPRASSLFDRVSGLYSSIMSHLAAIPSSLFVDN